jgi:hypothetical protein
MSNGLFDWHVTAVLSRTWRELIAPDPARFVTLFDGPGGQQGVPQDVLESWHAELTQGATEGERVGHVRFNTAFNPNTPQIPQVAIAMLDEPADKQPLNYALPASIYGVPAKSMMVREEVSIDIWTPHLNLTRSLHVCVRQVLMSQVNDFGRLGYTGLTYLGGADLMAEEGLMPGATEQPQVFVRRQRWQSISQPVWKGGAVAAKSPHVYSADVIVDNVQGGVTGDVDAGT